MSADDRSQQPALTALGPDDPRFGPPSRVTEAVLDPKPRLLPTHEMEWPDFERLLCRVAREVRGLRNVSCFGNQGQSQDGLDVIGLNASDEAEGVQGKRYQSFTASNLMAAVTKYVEGSLPFPLRSLAIGVSCEAHERSVIEKLYELNLDHAPLQIELWDRARLSEMLRTRPDIVAEFFGDSTATRFCMPHHRASIPVAGSDALGTANAVLRGPAQASGADAELDQAARTEGDDPDAALTHILRAKELLMDAGFPAHAHVLDQRIVGLLERLGRISDAARILLDRVWEALQADDERAAFMASRSLGLLASVDYGNDHGSANFVTSASALAEIANALYKNPLGAPPGIDSFPTHPQLGADLARLALLAGEIALAEGHYKWLTEESNQMAALSDEVIGHEEQLGVRLALLAADATGNWAKLVGRARTRSLSRALAALVLARHGRHLAQRGHWEKADQAWIEAVEQGCLAKHNSDAANWLHNRRHLETRYRWQFADKFHPLAESLNAMPTNPPIAAAVAPVRERALEAINEERLREAVQYLRRYLRDAVVSASWEEENDSRRLIADVFNAAGEPAVAARHLVLAGAASEARKLGNALADANNYVHVGDPLDFPTYWTRAAAFNLIAGQADLIPDDCVAGLGEQALRVLDDADAGGLIDTRFLAPSVYLAAVETLAEIAERLTRDQAVRLLKHLEPLAEAPTGTYRHTDDPQQAACARIGQANPDLEGQALQQIVALMSRGRQLREPAETFLKNRIERVSDAVERLAAEGNHEATSFLAYARPSGPSEAEAEAAADALSAPRRTGAGQFSLGAGAVAQSMAARILPADRRAALIRTQMERARLPYENSRDRSDFLVAAANLATDLPEGEVDELFDLACREMTDPARSEADAFEREFSHPLGNFRVSGNGDSRAAGALLAARLTHTDEQRAMVRRAALSLIGVSDDYLITRTFQVLGTSPSDELLYLAKQDWALRSLAALGWADNEDADPALGTTLARDKDVRVRRALAAALAKRESTQRTQQVRSILAADPRYSVRACLRFN